MFCIAELPRLSGAAAYTAAAVAVVIFCIALVSFALTLTKDPGIVPRMDVLARATVSDRGRAQMRQLAVMYCELCEAPSDASEGAGFDNVLERVTLERFDDHVHDVDSATHFWTSLMTDRRLQHLKMCSTCRVRRPLGCSHCRFCDTCTLGFDHHCFWIDNCVGARNHRSFVVFLVSAATSATLIAVIGVVDAMMEVHNLAEDGVFDDWRAKALAGLVAFIVLGLISASCCMKLPQAVFLGLLNLGLCLLLVAWVVFGVFLKPVPWQPLVVSVVAGMGASAGLLISYDQLSLVGRGITVKRAASRLREYRRRLPFSWWTVCEFLARPTPASLLPPDSLGRSSTGDVDLDSEEEEDDADYDEDEVEGISLNGRTVNVSRATSLTLSELDEEKYLGN